MTMQNHFYELADYLAGRMHGGEIFLASFDGEQSDFIRFNHSKIRQAGSVEQRYIGVDLVSGQRHAAGSTTVSGDAAQDHARLDALLADLREKLAATPEDPYLLYATDVKNTKQPGKDELPDRQAVLDKILAAGSGRDLVGIYAQGGIFKGFANSLGQRNWSSCYPFNLDWSFYHEKDKAVKTNYAGFAWDGAEFERKAASAVEQLEVLKKPAKTIKPGEYRVYITPAAMHEVMMTLRWGAFSAKAHHTKTTPLIKMVEAGATLDPSVTISENTREGIAANFQGQGFIKPGKVTLIENGRYRDTLVSPRSAKEYGIETNGASGGEGPESIDMAGGSLNTQEILGKFDTGVYINQLWYMNYSDTVACRMTGMTRFATFWIENGRIAAPLNVMRFDETIYRMLGENLAGLTAERDFLIDAHSYGARSTLTMRLPGVLADNFRFTL